ncbi:MAG: AarF/ABC1/UbiB kinase family protein [Myxococcales bacterium]|nr:AarF/ABC1/UbiB kinase family protein [Myxococcales bacterium]
MDEVKRIPVGRLRRLARLARVGTRTGTSLLFSTDGDGAAQQAAAVLGSMRGLAAKLGQMASYVDGLVPETQRAAFEEALKKLRSEAPQSPPDAIRSVVEEDLGNSLDQLFAQWSPSPFASASIGQVHHAVLPDGQEVAVKVQHPGIDAAVEADLHNGGTLKQLAKALASDDLNADALFDEVATRFREELDYRLEATRQTRFAKLYPDEPRIVVPRVIDTHSARRVLTSELAAGMSLEEAAAQPEATRRTYCEVLWHFAFKAILVDGLFNADPHPGNYLFHQDGRVTFLDFGCVQELGHDSLAHSRAAHLAALHQDRQGFERAVVRLGNTRGGAYEEAFRSYLHRCMRPIFSSPFRITRDFVSGLVQEIFGLNKLALTRDSQIPAVPESTVLLNRLQFGFMSVLARLNTEVDYAMIERAFFERAQIT